MDLTPHILDEEAPPSIVINPHSELGKELRKWEQHQTHLVPQGTRPGNPYVFRPYPKMLYKAQQRSNGQYACMLPTPVPYDFDKADQFERAVLMKESFDRSCQRIVKDEAEDLIAQGQGWADTIPAAMARAEAHERAIADAAAEAAAAVRRMTATAQREYAEAETQTHAHVTDVQPKKKRGRPNKGVQAVSGAHSVEG